MPSEVMQQLPEGLDPAGFRKLILGERILPGDFYSRNGRDWLRIDKGGDRWNPLRHWPVIRLASPTVNREAESLGASTRAASPFG